MSNFATRYLTGGALLIAGYHFGSIILGVIGFILLGWAMLIDYMVGEA